MRSGTLACSLMTLAACFATEVRGELQTITSDATIDELSSIDGVYDGCTARSGAWSVAIAEGAVLSAPPLSVVAHDTTCRLVMTAIVAGTTLSIDPPLALTTELHSSASRAGTEVLVNARLDSTAFADDFLLTVVVSDDPALAESSVPSRYSYRTEVVRDHPLSYWRLGETSGTTAGDEMALSHGTYQSVTLDSAGALLLDADRAVDLATTSSRISVPHVAAYDLVSRVTIEAWIRPDTVTGTRGILDNGGNYFLYIEDGELVFGIRTLILTSAIRTSVTAGAWHHVVGTYDGTKLVLYRNGVAVQSASVTGAILLALTPLAVGAMTGSGTSFDGTLDEVALYDSALSATRIATHHARGTE